MKVRYILRQALQNLDNNDPEILLPTNETKKELVVDNVIGEDFVITIRRVFNKPD